MITNRKQFIKIWHEWKGFAIFMLLMMIFRSAVADWNYVPTGSMKPTIMEGDEILIDKLAYDLKFPFTNWKLIKWDTPKKGEIVVFLEPTNEQRYVKRVIATAGEKVSMINNQLFINGEATSNEFITDREIAMNSSLLEQSTSSSFLMYESIAGIKHPVMLSVFSGAKRSFEEITVPQDHLFVMGDNRDNSRDSRYFGFVEVGRVLGKATRVVASLDQENFYLPRTNRFMEELP